MEKEEDIDEIIEKNDECEEDDLFKPSHMFLTISLMCLIIVFGLIKGLCIFAFVVGCVWFFNEEKPSNKPKDKENTN